MRLKGAYFSRVRYRVFQFWDVLQSSQINPGVLEPAQSVLTDEQMAIFIKMHPSEIRHGLRILRTLKAHGETNPDLLTAALLHDVGKTRHPLYLWERILIVLTKKLFQNRIEDWGNTQPNGWKRPFVVAQQHPKWGSKLANEAGTSPLACYLIREHQNKTLSQAPETLENQLLAALQTADRKN